MQGAARGEIAGDGSYRKKDQQTKHAILSVPSPALMDGVSLPADLLLSKAALRGKQ